MYKRTKLIRININYIYSQNIVINLTYLCFFFYGQFVLHIHEYCAQNYINCNLFFFKFYIFIDMYIINNHLLFYIF